MAAANMADGSGSFNALPLIIGVVGGVAALVCLFFSVRKIWSFVFADEDKPKDIQFVDVTPATSK